MQNSKFRHWDNANKSLFSSCRKVFHNVCSMHDLSFLLIFKSLYNYLYFLEFHFSRNIINLLSTLILFWIHKNGSNLFRAFLAIYLCTSILYLKLFLKYMCCINWTIFRQWIWILQKKEVYMYMNIHICVCVYIYTYICVQ